MKTVLIILIIAGILVFITSITRAQSKNNWTLKNAEEWFKSKIWANGLDLNAHNSTDVVEFAKEYHKNKELWDKAFAYLRDMNPDSLVAGKYPLIGEDVYVSVMDNKLKKIEDAKWEAHRKYIDIQYVVKGKEIMGVAPVKDAKEIDPFDNSKDVGFYTIDEKVCKYYNTEPGTFLIFFPSDAHRPSITTEGCEVTKKIVIKIRY